MSHQVEDCVIVIPARYDSSRFPGKALMDIKGEPLVVRMARIASATGCHVVVATDSPQIEKIVRLAGFSTFLSLEKHRCGTSRVAEAIKVLGYNCKLVINLQCDEPMIQPKELILLIQTLKENPEYKIATLITEIEGNSSSQIIRNPDRVKVTKTLKGEALYFSRSIIPYFNIQHKEIEKIPYYIHLGVYAFQRETLEEIGCLSETYLERAENLEQLSWIQHGYRIMTVESEVRHIPIDSPQDLSIVNDFLK